MQGEVWLISITHNKWLMAHFRWIMKKRLPLKNDWPRLVFILKLSDSLSICRPLLIGWRIRNQIRNPDKLNGTLEEKHKTKKILDEQQRKLQVNLRRCQVEMEKCTREHDALNSKIEELELYDDSSQRELKRKRLTQFTKFHFLIHFFDFDFLLFWFSVGGVFPNVIWSKFRMDPRGARRTPLYEILSWTTCIQPFHENSVREIWLLL